MPVSSIENLTPIACEIERLSPKKVLDLGCGFGKYGVLAREVLDATYGRLSKFDWQTEIFGVEAWPKYANPVWNAYNAVHIGDFTEMYHMFTHYDLILAIDTLEHLDKSVAFKVLDFLVAHNRNVIVSVPIGTCPQGAVFGNPYEEHKADWHPNDLLTRYLQVKELHRGICSVVSIQGDWNGN
jgi:2-polyprenyl-3-methyl-5-hydroxy-6-metoxy-1,4-benzoquinol methylase